MRSLLPSFLLLLSLPLPAQVAPPTDAVGRSRMLQRAERLRLRGDDDGARQLAQAVLVFAPDDFAARTFLGYRHHRGRWRLPQEIAYLERAAGGAPAAPAGKAAAAADAGAAGEADEGVVEGAGRAATPAAAQPPARANPPADADRAARLRQLWLDDEAGAAAARAALHAEAMAAHRPELAAAIDAEYRRARQPHRQAAAATATALGVLSVQLQNVRLLGFDEVTVGFGTGSGRLQLPRTESVSIGTTVAVPLGFGR